MKISDERARLYFDIWSKAVDTQMHFNEMSTKSRQLGLAFVAAALGVALVLLARDEDFTIEIWADNSFNVATLIVFGAALGLMVVRNLDLGVYHKMLRGAVAFGEDFEENYLKQIFDLDLGMTQAISHFSRYADAKVENLDGKSKYLGETKVTAGGKIGKFYSLTVAVLLFFSSVLLAASSKGTEIFQLLAKIPLLISIYWLVRTYDPNAIKFAVAGGVFSVSAAILVLEIGGANYGEIKIIFLLASMVWALREWGKYNDRKKETPRM